MPRPHIEQMTAAPGETRSTPPSDMLVRSLAEYLATTEAAARAILEDLRGR